MQKITEKLALCGINVWNVLTCLKYLFRVFLIVYRTVIIEAFTLDALYSFSRQFCSSFACLFCCKSIEQMSRLSNCKHFTTHIRQSWTVWFMAPRWIITIFFLPEDRQHECQSMAWPQKKFIIARPSIHAMDLPSTFRIPTAYGAIYRSQPDIDILYVCGCVCACTRNIYVQLTMHQWATPQNCMRYAFA